MQQRRIVLVGATGKLGERIARELRKKDVPVCAIVRPGTSEKRLNKLRNQNVELIEADLFDRKKVAQACTGATCVVSALLGLEDVLVEAQSAILDASVEAGVPRFIPSDFAMDFTKVKPDLNRNFDIHRTFRKRLNDSPIRSTTILNGAFMELLNGDAPLVLSHISRVLYWGKNPDQQIDFTTMDDTAAYTAAAAVDFDAPEILRISGERISALGLARVASKVSGKKFRLLRGGSLMTLKRIISITQALTPKTNAPFPIWQGMQYLYCMFEGSGLLQPLDNDRYPGLTWTGVESILDLR